MFAVQAVVVSTMVFLDPSFLVGLLIVSAVVTTVSGFALTSSDISKSRISSKPVDSGWLDILRKTRERLAGGFGRLFQRSVVDEAWLEELETALIGADVGVGTCNLLLDRVRIATNGNPSPTVARQALREAMLQTVTKVSSPIIKSDARPTVVLIVGVNGSGKTTSIGKLSAMWTRKGEKVLIAAGDTYRAAAIEQLQIWAERAGAEVIATHEGADPGAVIYDALQSGVTKAVDKVIIDTAGRLQTTKPLMDQLSKIRRVIDKVIPGAPHETWLIIDGTMGQNALSQAKLFHEATPLTGVIVTKLDGTAKGGMILTLASELRLPVIWVGVGEKLEDLRSFDAEGYVDGLLPESDDSI